MDKEDLQKQLDEEKKTLKENKEKQEIWNELRRTREQNKQYKKRNWLERILGL